MQVIYRKLVIEDFSLLNNAPLKIDSYLSRHLFDKFGSDVLSNSIYPRTFRRKSGDIVIPPIHPSVHMYEH